MANPVLEACPLGQWTKVATNVTTGIINVTSEAPQKYTQTYRLTGDPVPTDLTEAVPFEEELVISSSSAIDVYIQPLGAAGEVRVNL